ncbi:MAG: hypothetical protein AAB510_00115 [Patescibacteria group bacterium]
MLNLLNTIQEILNSLIPLFVTIGIVYFVFGVVQYFIADAEEAKKNGRDRIIYGIIGLAAITGLWGLVKIVQDTFGVSNLYDPNVSVSGVCRVGTTFATLVYYIICIINKSVIPLLFAVSILVFVYGTVNFFIIGAGEEAKRTQGKQFMIWGVVALTVMLSVWGLVKIFGSTFNINTSVIPQTKE